MEWYKLRTTKMFIILASITFAINMAITALVPAVLRLFGDSSMETKIADAISNPFIIGLLFIPVFISAIGFLYADFSGGYIKNYAGQVGSRGKIVVSKFIVLGIHNLIFFALGSLSSVLGSAIGGSLVIDGNIMAGVGTLLLKWLLSMALCSIIMFFAVGIKNKTFATIIGVIFATGALNLIYLGIDTGVMNLFKLESFSISEFLPDALMNSVNVAENTMVLNAIIVGIAFIAAFTILTIVVFKKRDIK